MVRQPFVKERLEPPSRIGTGASPPHDWLLPVGLVALAVFAAHFTRVAQFGLYEDDYWGIAPHLFEPVARLWDRLVSDFTYWPTGRPLNHFLPAALASLGSRLGGLRGVYAVAAAWLVLNCTLVYLCVRRITSEAGAVVAALAYVVYPADTTRILLLHAAHVQGAMTFLLLGVLLWLRGGWARAASYPVAGLALLSYETAFLPFLVLPLLRVADRRTVLRTWAIHLLVCGAIVAFVAAVRLRTGDVRAIEAAHLHGRSAYRILTSVFLGPYTSGGLLLSRAMVGLREADLAAVISASVVVLGFVAVVRRARLPRSPEATSSPRWPRWLAAETDAPHSVPWWWLLASAVVAWAAAYALTLSDFSYPPTQEVGRLTSTHVAAAWPAALAIAALYEGARRLGRRSGGRVAAVVFSAWLASMVVYHQYLQREYARTWAAERAFWRQVVTLAPEAGPGWTVIVGGTPRQASPVILTNSWADWHVFRQIFTAGLDARGANFTHLGYLQSTVRFRRVGQRVEWRPQFWGGPFEPIEPERLVLLWDDGGTLRRVGELETEVGVLTAPAAPPSVTPTELPATPVARLLFPERSP